MTMLSRHETADFLRQHTDYLILTHRRPDGDTIGSAAVLCRMLRAMGKTAHILENPQVGAYYRRLHRDLTTGAVLPHHCVISVDVAAPELLTDPALQSRIALRIDHHATAASFAPRELVEPAAGACGDILYDLLVLLEIPLDIPMAEALYTAVSTDTGCFRYANTTAHSYQVAAACAQTGADLATLNRVIFDTNSLARLRLQGWMVEHMQFLAEGRVAVCALPRQVEEQLGATEEDLENISGFPRSIAGVVMAATLRESTDNTVKLSVRAIPGYDAAAVCAAFGGGGHKGAAGATLALPLEQAAQVVAEAMLQVLTDAEGAVWTES